MDLIKPLITLLAIVEPAGDRALLHPPHMGCTDLQRKRTAWVSAFSAFVVIAVSALLGLQLLSFFGISIASFQVGGGMLLLISSLSRCSTPSRRSRKTNKDEIRATEVKASLGASIAVVPLTIPLLTGPATMSTVVIFADRTQHVSGAGDPGRLRRGDRPGDRRHLLAGRADRAGARQDRHQRDDTADAA